MKICTETPIFASTDFQKNVPLFDLMEVENDCVYMTYFIFSEPFYFNLYIWYKAIQNQLEVSWAMAKIKKILKI